MYSLSIDNVVKVGVGWRSVVSARLPPMWPWFDSRNWRHMWVKFLLFLILAPRIFSSDTPVFPRSSKTKNF